MNDYYCVLPFYSVETKFSNPNKNIYCCRLQPDTDIRQLRNNMLAEERTHNCNTCWKLENAGLTSERQIHNQTMDFLLDLNIDNIEKRSIAKGFDPVNIKLATSNLCNGQCVTCNSTLSSAWAQLEGKSTQYISMDFDKLDADVDWSRIVSLSFVGGEPLLEKKNIDLLEKLVELNNTKCFISFVTNGSVTLSERQVNLFRKFENLNICLSIDGTESVFEYVRYPMQWATLLKNLKVYRTITNNISVSCMISNLNIYYYSNIVDFFKDQGLNYLCKQVEDPIIFSPANLSPDAKQQVLKNNPAYQDDVAGFLNIDNIYNEELYKQYTVEIARQDSLKKINVKDYMYLL